MHGTTIKSTPAAKAPKKVAKALTPMERLLALAENGCDPAVFAEVVGVIEADRTEKQSQAWHDAMRACQSELGQVSKDASNTQTRSKYVTLGALDAALRPVYLKHGFDVTFSSMPSKDETVPVIMTITHEAGYSRRFNISVPCDGQGIKGATMMTRTHAVASAVSYGRRYLLTMAFNVATTDDDGNAAGVRPVPVSKPADDMIKKVTPEQAEALIEFADQVKADKRLLCQFLAAKWHIQVNSFVDIPDSKYKEVIQQLERKRDADKQKPQL